MTDMETPVPVIFRKEENGSIIAFILDCPANIGNIVCLDRISGHGEASIDYYYNTKKATPEEYADFKHWMETQYGYVVNVRHRISNKDRDIIGRTWK